MEFEWNKSKALVNLKKHLVSFEEAVTVFGNPLALTFSDELHSTGEYREIIVGHSKQNRLLFVSFTERVNCVRIISARVATREESKKYEQDAF